MHAIETLDQPSTPTPDRRRQIPMPVIIVVGAALVLCLPGLGLPAYYESFLYLIFFWIAIATAWSIFSGNTGYFSFGTGAFYGVGAYTTANLVQTQSLALAVIASGIIATLIGIAVGAVVFRVKRLRGEVFALLTLALTFVVASIMLNTPIDGGAGVFISGIDMPELFGSASATLYVMQGTIAALALLGAWAVQRSRFGMGLLSISDAEDIAEVFGVPTYAYKIAAFAISCFIIGIAGGVHALFISYITVSETFSITVPLFVILMGVLGGARHWFGATIGAVIIATLTTAFVDGDSALFARAAIGLTLVLSVLFLPEGVMGRLLDATRHWRRAARISADNFALDLADRAATIAPPSADRLILSVKGVGLSFKGLKALDGVDLDVREGEILGLVGPNGSGKSTLINSISGFYKPQEGRIEFAGRNVVQLDGHTIAGLGIARTFQIPQPFVRMSVLDNVRLAALFGGGRKTHTDHTAEAWRWLHFVGLADRADALPSELNLHQRKFLELARTLATGSKLILLDEVLAGMTPAEINGALELIRKIRSTGASIVFVEHNIRAVLELTDRVAVLDQGKIVALGDPRTVMQEPAVVAAYLGGGSHA